MTTIELCNALGVSRSWVNRYLRSMGTVGWDDQHPNLRWVYYDEGDIVDYINAHAIFDRKTTWINLTDFADEVELKKQLLDIKNIKDDRDRQKAYWDLVSKTLPPDTVVFSLPNLDARNRGKYPWRKAKRRITQLDELCTMADLQGEKSAELVYRDAFASGWLRVRVHGHTWFVMPDQPTSDDLALLVPAMGDD